MMSTLNELSDCLSNIFFFCEPKDKLSFLATTKNIRDEVYARIPNIEEILGNERYILEKDILKRKMKNYISNIPINEEKLYQIVNNYLLENNNINNYLSEDDMYILVQEYIDIFSGEFDKICAEYVHKYVEKDKDAIYHILKFNHCSFSREMEDRIRNILEDTYEIYNDYEYETNDWYDWYD